MTKKINDSDGKGFKPTANIKVEGKMIRGVLVSRRDVKTRYGDKPVYVMTVQDATCEFESGGELVEPQEGAEVEFFSSTRLTRQLVQVPFGSVVTITHKGMKKFGSGQPAHTYEVLVEEAK